MIVEELTQDLVETGYQIDRVLPAQFDLAPREFTDERGLDFYQRLHDRAAGPGRTGSRCHG